MKQPQLPGTSLSQLEEAYAKLDSELDHMSWRNDVGLDVDMVKWYSTIAKMESIQKEIAHIQYEQDPFEPCDPPTEPEYDEYQEWQQMTAELRRGEA